MIYDYLMIFLLLVPAIVVVFLLAIGRPDREHNDDGAA